MKAHMNSHVAHERHTMFRKSANNVRNQLKDMIKHVEDLMGDKTDEVFTQMRRDYRSIIGGVDTPQAGEILPKDQRLARKGVRLIIEGVEKAFMKVAGVSIDNEEEDSKEMHSLAPYSDDEVQGGQSSNNKKLAPNTELTKDNSPSDQLAGIPAPSGSPTSKVKRSASVSEADNDIVSDVSSGAELQSPRDQQGSHNSNDLEPNASSESEASIPD